MLLVQKLQRLNYKRTRRYKNIILATCENHWNQLFLFLLLLCTFLLCLCVCKKGILNLELYFNQFPIIYFIFILHACWESNQNQVEDQFENIQYNTSLICNFCLCLRNWQSIEKCFTMLQMFFFLVLGWHTKGKSQECQQRQRKQQRIVSKLGELGIKRRREDLNQEYHISCYE